MRKEERQKESEDTGAKCGVRMKVKALSGEEISVSKFPVAMTSSGKCFIAKKTAVQRLRDELKAKQKSEERKEKGLLDCRQFGDEMSWTQGTRERNFP